jgi:hypothetical protein
MTNNAPPHKGDAGLEARITAVRTDLTHFREIQEIRHEQILTAIGDLRARNTQQDTQQEVLEEKLLRQIEKINQLLWNAMRWLGGLLASTLLMLVLKGSNLI